MKTKTLNLANIEKSDIKYKMTTFPDGEPHIQFEEIDNKYPITVKTRICNPNDLYTLLLVRDVLDRWGVFYSTEISYLMSARMDRLMDITRPVSINIVKNILGIQSDIAGKKTYIFDCHADIPCPDLYIRNIASFLASDTCNTFVFPDFSAHERYIRMLHISGADQHFLPCEKKRKENSVITHIDEKKLQIIKEQEKITIIDDIIDGGRTISNVIDIVRENAPNVKISVYASHCVNKEGLNRILQKSDKLTTTNSYKDWQSEPDLKDNPKLNVIEII